MARPIYRWRSAEHSTHTHMYTLPNPTQLSDPGDFNLSCFGSGCVAVSLSLTLPATRCVRRTLRSLSLFRPADIPLRQHANDPSFLISKVAGSRLFGCSMEEDREMQGSVDRNRSSEVAASSHQEHCTLHG